MSQQKLLTTLNTQTTLKLSFYIEVKGRDQSKGFSWLRIDHGQILLLVSELTRKLFPICLGTVCRIYPSC